MSETTAVVVVKSAWWSKINWVQVASLALNGAITLVSGPYLGLDAPTQVKLLSALGLIQSILTVVIKTWITPTVTPQSIA